MYDTAGPIHLDYLNQQHLPRRYESEEEDISESEMGGHDHAFSPVESYEPSNADISESEIERPGFPRLLPTYSSSGKTSRPVSMDTIKRSSGTTFVADSYIFEHDDDVIIELPSPDATSPLQSPIFLPPSVYVPSESPVSTRPQSLASLSSASMYPDDESDVLVAEQVKIVEPIAKPNLILISPVSEHSSSPFKDTVPTPNTTKSDASENVSQGLYSHRRAATSQPLLWNKWDRDSAQDEALKRGSMHLTTRELEQLPTGSGATIRLPVEVPQLPPPMTQRTHSMTFSRPATAVSEKFPSSELHSRRPTDILRRPQSIRSLSSASLPFFHGRHTPTSADDDSRTRSMSYTHSSARSIHGIPSQSSCPPSRTASPSPYYSSPSFTRERSGSSYSSSSFSRPHPLKKASTSSSIYSSSSLRSEVESLRSLDPRDVAETDFQQKVKRKKSLRHVRQSTAEPSEGTSKKSFMEFMFGSKRKSTIKSLNA
ncbi:uncharacterized protein BDW43DRAFT_318731 [Aspergillus alliaceus]|uniref:uncharacterized protein n=1 Tax=Petromyces alliaceus TaxID=209559 RepID=UPI0012A77909|nr:uncharacterized protein BDW43DRAFT_318731 [Aspergillus alliaceus]KAB8234787.1 hypothetical protein BDW43DRAFT_318731 [Aspergillus alliaceus]